MERERDDCWRASDERITIADLLLSCMVLFCKEFDLLVAIARPRRGEAITKLMLSNRNQRTICEARRLAGWKEAGYET
jgi:hypothetical protein